jgi:hypothetical protein
MTYDYADYPAQPRPAVVTWFKVYAAVLCLLYVAVAAASVIFFTFEPAELDMSPAEARIMGVLFLVMGAGLFVVCLIPLLVSPRPWVWIYDLVIICLGMTSICFWPACIPLIIFWLKPETKAYFEAR